MDSSSSETEPRRPRRASVREGHFLVGWVEWIAIDADGTPESNKALEIADEQVARLNNYPVLDEHDFSEEEQTEADETWRPANARFATGLGSNPPP